MGEGEGVIIRVKVAVKARVVPGKGQCEGDGERGGDDER